MQPTAMIEATRTGRPLHMPLLRYASGALRRACLENHHIFGAIGYSEEHPAYYQFKRVHSDLFRYGGGLCAREELAVILLDDGKDMPDYDLGEAGEHAAP